MKMPNGSWEKERAVIVEQLEVVSLQNIDLMTKLHNCYLTIISQSKQIYDLTERLLRPNGLQSRKKSVPGRVSTTLVQESCPERQRQKRISKMLAAQTIDEFSAEEFKNQLYQFESLLTKQDVHLFDNFRRSVSSLRSLSVVTGDEVFLSD